MLRRRRKIFDVEGGEDVEPAAYMTTLESPGNEWVTCVLFLRDLVVAASFRGNVRVYGRDELDSARALFTEHVASVYYLAQLEDDLVVSVGRHGQMFTWRPSTTETIGSWKDEEEHTMGSVAKLDNTRLVLGTMEGDLIVLSHSRGANLRMERRLRRKHGDWITAICVRNGLVISCSDDKTAKLWSKATFRHLATLRHKNCVGDVAVSDTHIVTVCGDGHIYFQRNAPPYALDFILQTPYDYLGSVLCLNSDVVAVAGFPGRVSFISLSKKSYITQVQVSQNILDSLAVLSDHRIAAVDERGLCMIFCPPQQVQYAVHDYATMIYRMDIVKSAMIHPILDAWNAVQQHSLSLIDACENVIRSENTKRSLDEWCFAHNLLMQAVNVGLVPRCRDYKGTVRHWHRELYRHCDKLAIGAKEIDFLIQLFDEAERAGVIAEGTSESFIYAVDIRADIDENKWHSANAIYQLFLRQAETDASLRRVLHYQKVQQITSMVNAVLGVVPIGGSIAANVIAGGTAILNDFQVCGLVESLVGTGQELSGGFGSSNLVDLFLRRGNEVLIEDHWNEWGEENRRAVEDAARNLGLTVTELRDRLVMAKERRLMDQEQNGTEVVEVVEEVNNHAEGETCAAKIPDAPANVISNAEIIRLKDALLGDVHALNQDENGIEVIEVVEENGRNNHAKEDTSRTQTPDAHALVVSNAEMSELNMNGERARIELANWANEWLNKASIEKLKDEEAASCMAAFLVNYSKHHVASYMRLKDALLDVFLMQFIDGSSFVHADGKQREVLIQAGMSAIEMVAKGNASGFLGIRLKLFLQKVLES